MKKARQFASILLAIAIVAVMALPAFAVQTGTLTINGTVEGREYDLYKIFNLTQSGDNYSYTVNPAFTGYFSSKSISDPVAHIGAMSDDSEALSLLAQDILAWAIENGVTTARRVVGAASPATSTNVPGLDFGYYLLNPLGGSGPEDPVTHATMFALHTLSGGTTEINVKAEYPTITKTLSDDTKNNEMSIGDDVQFKLTSKVPDMTGYNYYYFVVNDKMSEGLTYDDIDSITIGSTVLDSDDYYVEKTDNPDGTTSLRIIFKNFIQYAGQAGATVEILYTAQLNTDAAIGGINKNEADLTYSNDPTYDYDGNKDPSDPDDPSKDPGAPKGETPKSETGTYTTSLTINKTDGTNPLTGASFRITGSGVNIVITSGDVYEVDAAGTYWKLTDGTYTTTAPEAGTENLYESTTIKYNKSSKSVLDTNTAGVSAEAFVDSNGQLTFEGLGAGTYTISEIVTPNGYNTIDDITFIITFDPSTQTFAATYNGNPVTASGNAFEIDVVNESGIVLPSTGGIGTTIFYVLGGFLALAAAILLITKKRMANQK